jgi:hypothetical protein
MPARSAKSYTGFSMKRPAIMSRFSSPARGSNAVLVGEEDWNAIQETLHLLSVPGMRESIIEGLATPVGQCEKEPGW